MFRNDPMSDPYININQFILDVETSAPGVVICVVLFVHTFYISLHEHCTSIRLYTHRNFNLVGILFEIAFTPCSYTHVRRPWLMDSSGFNMQKWIHSIRTKIN